MYLTKSKRKDGRIYLSIAHSYRKGGKSTTRTVKSLGYLDTFEGTEEEIIARFTDMAKKMDDEYRTEHAPITLSFSLDKKVNKRAVNRKMLGHVVPAHYYHSLGIHTFWHTRQVKREFEYDANAIFRLLVFERIFAPGSKAAAFAHKDRYFERTDFELEDVYRSLDFFARYKDALIKRMNEGIASLRGRDTTSSYYDVTNYYFEIDKEDGLRRFGCSKEHRKSPIVQMGLLMDADGIPLTYRLYPGNTNDALTMLPILKQLKEDFVLGKTIVVADRGNNTSDNIAANVLDGNGFVYSQTIRGADSELKGWVLDQDGYEVHENSKRKSRQGYKTVHIKDQNNKTHDVKIAIKQVAFWSADYDARAKAERKKVIEKALKLAKSPSAYANAKSYGAARYVKEHTVDTGTGEILDTVCELDEDAIAQAEVFDGYYCIITSETDWSDDRIIECYRGLWRIEESFKVLKTNMECRPVYVSDKDHIEAHFLICYVALVLTRLMQADTSYRYSAERIINDLEQLQCSMLKENWWHLDFGSDLIDELCDLAGVRLNTEILSTKTIRKALATSKRG
jgi:hypothetical protein